MSTAKPTLLLEHHLKELKLPTILREYAAVAGVCSNERADYPTYLLRLCERELIDRERRAAERRIKAARFPVPKEEFGSLLSYLDQQLRSIGADSSELADACLGLYALALAGRAEPAYHEKLFSLRAKLDAEDKALLALAVA